MIFHSKIKYKAKLHIKYKNRFGESIRLAMDEYCVGGDVVDYEKLESLRTFYGFSFN